MCGRSRCALAPDRVEQASGVQHDRWVDRERYRPSHNVSPGAWTPILRLDEQNHPQLQTMRWGLVPSFTKPGDRPDFYKMFNARSESVAEKPVFSRLLKRQRCVVLLDGFYEWKTDAGGKKQPYYCSFGEGKVMKMAGLFDTWAGGPEGPLTTYTILTTDAAPRLTWLHNRMPVILPDDDAVAAWLGTSGPSYGKAEDPHDAAINTAVQLEEEGEPEAVMRGKGDEDVQTEQHGVAGTEHKDHKVALTSWQDLDKLCHPFNGDLLTWHPVTPAMSKPSYDCPDASQDVRKKKGSISTFFKASGSKPTKTAAGASPNKATADSKAANHSEQKAQTAAGGPKQQKAAGKGSISSFMKPVAASPAADENTDKDDLSEVRNADEQAGPSKEDNEAAQQVAIDGKKRAADTDRWQGDAKRGRSSV